MPRHSRRFFASPFTRALATLPGLVPLALSGHAAHAQPLAALPTVTVSSQDAPRLDTPTATGSNLDLSPLQTPASVDVITREQLQQRGDASVVDAVTRAAGIGTLAHPGNGGSSLSARGFTDATSVMRLYDGTRQYGGVGVTFPFDTWSVERIEVLRGPASVIHGDGAIGGVVNVVPKKPTRGPIRHELQATLGTDGKRALAYGSGGAIGERLAYRFDISGDRSDGWVDRGDTRNLAFSGALQWALLPELSVKLSHAQGRQEPMRYFGTPLVNGRQLEALRKKNYNVADSAIEYRDRWTELSAHWTPNSQLVVRSKLYHITSDRYWRNAEAYAHNATTGLIDRADNTESGPAQTQTGTTTDATYSGTLFGLAHQVSLGFDASTSFFEHTNNTYTGSSGPVDIFNPVPGLYASSVPYIPRYRNKATQYSVFGENRLELTPQWSLVAGARFDHAEVSRTDLVAGNQAFSRTYANTGWRLGSVYLLQPTLAVYAQIAKAADPVAGLLMLSPANSAFDVSTGRQLEVGLKQSFWNKTGDWTLAAYVIKKNNLLARDPTNPALRVQVGERSARGVEGTLSLPLAKTLQLDANVALLRARYDDFIESAGGVAVSRAGKVPTDVPQRLANAWLGWTFLPDWTASAGLRHVGKRYADNANTLALPAYTTTDLALQWRAAPATTLTLRGFNVFDKHYFSTAYYSTNQWFVGEGRRVELTVNHRF